MRLMPPSSTMATSIAHKMPMTRFTVGADNPFGHPHQEALDRLERAGAAVFRTDQSGTIVIRR